MPAGGNDASSLLAELTRLSTPRGGPEFAAFDASLPPHTTAQPLARSTNDLPLNPEATSEPKGFIGTLEGERVPGESIGGAKHTGASLEEPPNCCGGGVCEETSSGVPALLSRLRGPWALAYWHAPGRTLWFGRDAVGRRCLLVHWPDAADGRLLLASVSAPGAAPEYWQASSNFEYSRINFWIFRTP